ncbi:MAG: hypothetical protein MUC94_03980 [bacterium]|jgi:tetratricopeptide (TPR) repeat protein|nr:hypothetical protein [bacterium]
MNMLVKYSSAIVISLAFIGLNCATMNQQRSASSYSREIQELKSALQANPNNFEALRDLGAIYYDSQQTKLALNFLIKAFKKNPKDPKCLAYLGMTLEAQQKNDLALKLYKRYSKLPLLSSYRKLMQGRHYLLTRKMIHDQMRSLLAQEEQLGATQLSPQAVAIFPLEYQGKNQDHAQLGKGISEMMITDLSQVPGLKLVERVRLQALMEEMALGQSGMIDENTAPRMGKLLSAGKIIHGNYDTEGNKKLTIDVAYWDMINNQSPQFDTKNETLQNLFSLEKELVFNLIDNMGIELTPQQRQKIQFVPTQNMQAFMAYCMGLNKEDAGQFNEAAQYYQQAVQLDPGFKMANQKLEMNEAVAVVQDSKGNYAMQTDNKGSKSAPPTSTQDLVSDRLQNLSSSIGANFIPGQDTRKSLEEVGEAGANIGLGNLPEPPPLPTRK